MKVNERATEKISDKHEVYQKILNVPAPFCALLYSGKARYLPVVTKLNNEKCQNQRMNNVNFLHRNLPSSPMVFSSFRILSIQALRNNSVEEELPVNYDNRSILSPVVINMTGD